MNLRGLGKSITATILVIVVALFLVLAYRSPVTVQSSRGVLEPTMSSYLPFVGKQHTPTPLPTPAPTTTPAPVTPGVETRTSTTRPCGVQVNCGELGNRSTC